METISALCRTDNPPIVLDGEMWHFCKTLWALVRPYFGAASIKSMSFIVSTSSGGLRRISRIDFLPPFISFLSLARTVRIRLASLKASIRCTKLRSGGDGLWTIFCVCVVISLKYTLSLSVSLDRIGGSDIVRALRDVIDTLPRQYHTVRPSEALRTDDRRVSLGVRI